jgi:uncharacterized protein YkwD
MRWIILLSFAFGLQAAACDFYQEAPDDRIEVSREREAFEEEIDPGDVDYLLMSEAVFHETNRRREEQGLEPLMPLPELERAACLHARDMVERDFFAHENPYDEARATPFDRVRLVGLEPRFVAENIATAFRLRYESGKPVYPREEDGETVFSYEPGGPAIEPHAYESFAEALLDGWMGSPGHRENILSEAPTFLGAACMRAEKERGMDVFYCVQVFFDDF